MKNSEEIIVLLDNVSKIYNKSKNNSAGIYNINFIAKRGELILILGPSGSGKTTLLTLIAGLIEPNEGKIFLFNNDIADYSKKEMQSLRATKIGFIFQTFLLVESLTAFQNIELVQKFARKLFKSEQSMQTINNSINYSPAEILNNLGIGYLSAKYPSTMSQGEKQRVAVARSIANDADIILADEPTASLAADQGIKIIQLLYSLAKNSNKCVIVVSHDQRLEKYSDSVILITDGRIQNKIDTR